MLSVALQMIHWCVANVFNVGNLATGVLVLLLIGVEWLFTTRKIPWTAYAWNATYSFMLVSLALALFGPINDFAIRWAQSLFGGGLFDLTQLPIHGVAGTIAAMFIAFFLTDFFQYWMHRWQHENKVLWQTHVLHHCDEHLNVTSARRDHVFEYLLMIVCIYVPSAIIFQTPHVMPQFALWLSLLPYTWAFFIHTNIKLGFGPLWWLVSSPQFHRIHHSIESRHRDKNYAVSFPILDVMFGTAYRAHAREYPESGVEGVQIKSFTRALWFPVGEWSKMFKTWLGGVRGVLKVEP